MIEHDFPEEFVPIAAELQRLPYLSPSRDFADRVIARVDRLNAAQALPVVGAPRHLALHQGGQRSVAPAQRSIAPRQRSLTRGALRVTASLALVATAAFMFVEIDVLMALLATAVTQYGVVFAAAGAQIGAVVLGAETVSYLQAGAVEAVLLYLTLAVALIGGYAGIRTAAHIASKRAA